MVKTSECNYHYIGLIRFWKIAAFAVLITVVMSFSAPSVQAASGDRILDNPPVLQLRQERIPSTIRLAQPAAKPDSKAEKLFDLNIVYTEGKLYNPATLRDDHVKLRSYVGTSTSQDTPYVAPTIEVKPGDTVRINLKNQLPDDPSCKNIGDINQPHCFNSTNLHLHGLWVSPTGNSDNVLLSINPGVSFTYEYNIPPDHPAGTFWYHPHQHGSTALQVASGMAGALIVRGDRLPSKTANGDIDTLLKGANIQERVLVLQQIQYACLDNKGAIKVKIEKDKNGQEQVVAWVCDTSDIGGIEFYSDPGGHGLFGPPTWKQSGRYTSINGLILPTFKAKSGEIERWRMIHAGVRDTISLVFRKLKDEAPSISTLKTVDADRYIRENCTGDRIDYHIIADDGLTRSQVWKTNLTTLQPGYRNDALVVFPKPGFYCVVDTSAPAAGSVSGNAESRQLLGVVEAAAGTPVTDIHSYLTEQLVAAAEMTMPVSIQDKVIDDLKDGLKLTAFTPHLDIQDKEVTGKQELAFFIDLPQPNSSNPIRFEVSKGIGKNFQPKPYDHNRIDRKLKLGGVDEWTLQSYFVSHPFHIHVNPFQIVKILDPNGNDVSLENAKDDAGGQVDPQYQGLKGVWKDTLWVKSITSSNLPTTYTGLPGLYSIFIRTRYQRYIGEFVLHCHILDHEDQGMMQNVSIVIPNNASADTNTASLH